MSGFFTHKMQPVKEMITDRTVEDEFARCFYAAYPILYAALNAASRLYMLPLNALTVDHKTYLWYTIGYSTCAIR